MYARMKGLVAGFAILAVAACADTNQPLVPPADLAANSHGNLRFSVSTSHTQEDPQTATGTRRGIDFTGSVTTGNPCYNVSAAHQTSGSSVTLTVTATSTGGFCTQVITYHNYDGAVSQLSAGTYDFTVVHVVNGSSYVAYQDTVTVG
jgi:hypothetical protein